MENIYTSNAYAIICVIVLILFLYIVRREIYQIIFGYGVPFVPTHDKKVPIFTEHLRIKKGQYFLDLGSGDGKILAAVEKKCNQLYGENHGITCIGIENSPEPYKLSIARKNREKLSYSVKKMDFFKEDFSKYDVIYSYTITYLMKKIWKKIQTECQPGTIFYSNSFKIPDVQEIEKIQTSQKNFIYVYEVK